VKKNENRVAALKYFGELMLSMRWKISKPAALILLAMLAGCASDKLHKEGMAQIQDGHAEEGIATLERAAREQPENLSIRADLKHHRDQLVNHILAKANSERAVGHSDAAEVQFNRVLKLDSDNTTARIGLELLIMDRRHDALIENANVLVKKGDLDGAKLVIKPVLIENPKNVRVIALQRRIEELIAKEQSAVQTLQAKFRKQVTLQFRDADIKMVFEALSRASGINVLLDKDIKAGVKASIFVKNVSVIDAIDLLLMQNQLAKKVISDDTLFIFPNTQPKLKEFQDLKIRSFHLVNADPKQMLTLIKDMLKTKDVFINEKTSSLVMRDTPEAIRLAEKLIHDQDIAEPEVMLEVEVLEVSKTRLTQIGVQYPSQLAMTPIASLVPAVGATGVTTTQLTLDSLKRINSTSIGVSPIPSLTLNAMLQDGDTNILSSPRIRVRNREKAKIMIGERVPMITNSLTPQTTGSAVVTGTVQYQDVGLKLEVEPDIHLDHEVSIKLGLEVSSLGSPVTNAAGSVVYRVGTRNTATVLRLKDGETQILAGLIKDDETNTSDKVPALGEMPLLGRLFSNKNGNKTKTEIVLSITPHIVGNVRVPDAREEEYWTGTETTLRNDQLMMRSHPALMPAPKPVVTPAPVAPAVVPVPAAGIAPPQLSWDGINQARVGDLISLSVNAQTTQTVGSFGVQIAFDPAVLKAVDVVDGGFLKSASAPAALSKNIDQASGQMTADLTGATGSGTGSLLTLMFEVIGDAPAAAVSINRITASDANGAALTIAPPAPHLISVAK
jgi:general secretion pathway protein D